MGVGHWMEGMGRNERLRVKARYGMTVGKA